VNVVVTGERQSEISVARSLPVEARTLYLRDLGYVDYDELGRIVEGHGEVLMRLKGGASPTIVGVRHGLRNGAAAVRAGLRLDDQTLVASASRTTIDVDAAFTGRQRGRIVLRVVAVLNRETDAYHWYVTSLPAEEFSPEEVAALYALRWVIELMMKLLRSSCHLDHLDTSNPGALRTHIYASLLAAVILSGIAVAAAAVHGIPMNAISPLVVGTAAPLFALALTLLWLRRPLTPEALADCILSMIAVGCRDQNPNRTAAKWGMLSRG
jgi:putative transposase